MSDYRRLRLSFRPKRLPLVLDTYWLAQAGEAAVLADSMPTTELKLEVLKIAAQFGHIAKERAIPRKWRKTRRR